MKVIIKNTDYPSIEIEKLIAMILEGKLVYGDDGHQYRWFSCEEEYKARLEKIISFGLLKIFVNLNKPLVFTLDDINKLFEGEFTLCLTEEERWV